MTFVSGIKAQMSTWDPDSELRMSRGPRRALRRLRGWAQMLADHAPENAVAHKIWKKLLQLNTKIIIIHFKNGQEHIQTFCQRRHPKGRRTQARCFCHHNHHGDANQNHGDRHLIPVGMAVVNMPSGSGCWRGRGEKGASRAPLRGCQGGAACDPQPHLGERPEDARPGPQRRISGPVVTSRSLTAARIHKQPKFPPTN